MLSRSSIYLFLFGLVFFAACRKDDLQTDYDYKTLGRSSRDLLASNLYSSLQIEVSYMPGHEPGSAALDSLAVFLQQYLNKPDGIHFVTHAIPASGKPSVELFDLVKIEKGNRNIFTKSNTLSVHVLI